MKEKNIQVERIIVGPLSLNCYIIWNSSEKKGAIVDPADDPISLLNKINQLKIDIELILATHGHFDYIGAVSSFKRETKGEFLAHKEDLFFIEDAESAANRWGFNIEKPPLPDRFLEDGDVLRIEEFRLKVLHTPGHSPGGVSFLYENIVLSGDTLFNGSIGRTDFRKGSFEELSKSIKNRLYTLSDDTIVYTSHGPITKIGVEK